MAFIQRYSTIIRGGIRFIGNTLGLSKAPNTNTAGFLGSIGAFTSNLATQVPTFPEGTTLNYLENASSSNLGLPLGSQVLYAELIWGGLYQSQNANISNLINNAVTLTINGTNYSVVPDATTSQDFLIPSQGQSFTIGFYVRSANVTNLVQSMMNGVYQVSQVPSLIIANDNQTSQTNHAGWTLAVVYANPTHALRNLTLWVGGAVVGPSAPVTDVTLSGFQTPTVLPIEGKVFLSSQEGDAVLTGDQFLFGPSTSELSVMSGPNNPANNFFASQINDVNGILDTTGTFGDRNAIAQTATNTLACRQGWDITAIDVSNKLNTSQTTAVFRFTSSGDLYVPNALAIQVDALGASLQVVKSVDNTVKVVGDNINYTITIQNTGELEASNVLVKDLLPEGLTLVDGSIEVDGVVQPNTFPISIASIAGGQTVTIKYSLVATTVPIVNPAVNVARVEYTFEPFQGFVIDGVTLSNPVSVAILSEQMNLIKTVDKGVAKTGDTLQYSSFIVNNGTLVAKNTIFTDQIPQGVTFVENSVVLKGIPQPGMTPDAIAIGVVNPTEVVDIVYQVTVDGSVTPIDNQSSISFDSILPDGDTVAGTEISNLVRTDVISLLFSKVKSSSETVLQEGGIATQTIVLKNDSKYLISNILFQDVMTSGAQYVAGSVKINTLPFPLLDPLSGFTIPSIPQNDMVTITYDILANDPKTADNVTNYGVVNYSVEDLVQGTVNFVENTNSVTIELVAEQVEVIKSVSREKARWYDTLVYSVVVKNTGQTTLDQYSFVDVLEEALEFIPGSVSINGTQYETYNPSNGFILPTIMPQGSVLVTFLAKIKYTKQKKIVNVAYVESSTGRRIESNMVTTYLLPPKPKCVQVVVKVITKKSCCTCDHRHCPCMYCCRCCFSHRGHNRGHIME